MSIFKKGKDRNSIKITGSANRLITVVKVEEEVLLGSAFTNEKYVVIL